MAAFQRRARPECPSCGEWTTWITDDPAATATVADGALALVCERCGFVRIHSAAVLVADDDASLA
jgi:ribosomal protein S27AE